MTDKYQDLREAISNAEYSDDAYWLDRYRGESGPETIRGLLAERDAMVEALTELCDEIDKHEIHDAISKTSILWFKRKARAALAAYRKGGEA